MTMYIRVGNQTVTAAQLNSLTPADVVKINEDAARAENMRQNNIAESMGLGLRKAPNTINLSAPDVRPGSELAKALVEDLLAKKATEAALAAPVQEAPPKKKRGRKPKVRTEIILAPENQLQP